MSMEITGLHAVKHISSDCVNIYDSVYSSVSTDTKMQIASLLCTGNRRITLKIHKVQFQDRATCRFWPNKQLYNPAKDGNWLLIIFKAAFMWISPNHLPSLTALSG